MSKVRAHIFTCWDEEGKSYYPERFSEQDLKDIRGDIGSSDFSNLYENRPVSAEDAPFKKEDLRYFEKIPKDTDIVTFMTVDLGGKDEATSTPTGIAIVAVDKQQNWYVLWAKAIFEGPEGIIKEFFRLYNIWQPRKIGVEREKYSITILPFLKVEEKQQNLKLPVEELKLKVNDRIAKKDRIMSLQPRIERGQLFIKKEQTELEDQLIRFPRGNLDILDALSRISQIAHPPRRKRIKRRQENDPIYYKTGRDYRNWARERQARKESGAERIIPLG